MYPQLYHRSCPNGVAGNLPANVQGLAQIYIFGVPRGVHGATGGMGWLLVGWRVVCMFWVSGMGNGGGFSNANALNLVKKDDWAYIFCKSEMTIGGYEC